MSKRIIRFSRLLRIFKLNDNNAFIIELEENNKKTLYISYGETIDNIRFFKSYNESTLKEEFKDLSIHCLMDQCTDASNMFDGSPITHFTADCSNVVNGKAMFYNSLLRFINTEFSLLENADHMFLHAKIKKIAIDFPKLKTGACMFTHSSLEKITSKFPLLENGQLMFNNTQLKEINCCFPKIKYNNSMFENTPDELKQSCPYYFA